LARVGNVSACINTWLIIDATPLESLAPSSALPIGAVRTLSEMQPVLVDPASSGSGLLNSVLALLAPFNPDESERYDEEILDLTVIGFLVVYVFWHTANILTSFCCIQH